MGRSHARRRTRCWKLPVYLLDGPAKTRVGSCYSHVAPRRAKRLVAAVGFARVDAIELEEKS